MPGPSPAEAPAASAFVDTNIWVYAHLKAPGDARHERALAVVQGGADLVISPQVVADYHSVMLRNAQTDAWIQDNLRAMFARTRLQPANALTLSSALDLRNRFGFSFWDCQIAAAALHAGCGALLTEDMCATMLFAALLPALQGANGDADKRRKLRPRQIRPPMGFDDGLRSDVHLTGLHFAHRLQKLSREIELGFVGCQFSFGRRITFRVHGA